MSSIAKATEGVKSLERSPEGLSGVRGAECWDSHQGNKGGLPRSRVHSPWKAWYKRVNVKSGPVPWEESEGEVVPLRERTTQPPGGKLPCFNRVQRGGK